MKKAEAGGKKLDEMTMRSILDDKDIAPKQPEPVKPPEVPAAGPTLETTGAAVNSKPPIPASPDVPAAPDTSPAADVPPWETDSTPEKNAPQPPSGPSESPKEDAPFKGSQERPEVTKVIPTGDHLRKYFPGVSMSPRKIEESVYSALEERRQRQLKGQQKAAIFKRGGGPSR